jgi:lactoylglutathione lyase
MVGDGPRETAGHCLTLGAGRHPQRSRPPPAPPIRAAHGIIHYPPHGCAGMKYLHTMIRVHDLDATLRFFCEGIGLRETRRMENEKGRYTLVFLAADETPDAEIELTYNWPPEDGTPAEDYGSARNFGHLAFRVGDIYAVCERLQSMGYTIHRPPRDGHMAFVRSPDLISIELLQEGHLPPAEPWASMPNTGTW